MEHEMQQIKKEADSLDEIMCKDPIRRAFSVDRLNLTERQYYLLRAAGFHVFTAETLGLLWISDYDAYRLCVYENGTSVSFMDPRETLDVVTIADGETGRGIAQMRLARSPEECQIRHLRPEQRDFFAKYRPDVLARMQPYGHPVVSDLARRCPDVLKSKKKPVKDQP